MDDQPKVQPSPVQPGQAAPGAPAPEHVTRAELEALRKEMQDTVSKSYRGVQARTDSIESRVQKALSDIDQSVERFKQAGIEVTPDQREKMRQNAVMNSFVEPAPPSPGQGQQAEPTKVDPMVAAVNTAAEAWLRSQGLDPTRDESWAGVKTDAPTIEEFFASLYAATAAKKTASPQQAAARMPMATETAKTASAPSNDMDELWKRAKIT